MFVHAINPYGFAWTRRVTEEGNDLNRNYVDHTKPYPVNEGYLEIADYLVPADLATPASGGRRQARRLRKKVGDVAYFRAVSGGQYSHPDGMFFGGGGPSWSNRTLHAITDKFLKGRERRQRSSTSIPASAPMATASRSRTTTSTRRRRAACAPSGANR